MALKTSTRQIGEVVVVQCEGRIVLGEESNSLRVLVKDLLNKSRHIVLDIGEVRYIDSSGLGTLVTLYTSARNAGGEIKLANLNARHKDLLQMTKLFTVFETFDTAESGAASFKKAAKAT